jgi:glycosyltransferase involved in cell wall biosynthesis
MKQEKQVRNEFLSLVMPAYKAEAFIEKNILEVKKVLDELPYNYEYIIVVDGMLDKTQDKAKKVAAKFPDQIKVVGYKENMGKGHAVRFGMARAKGDIIGFTDAGLDLEPTSIPMLLEHFNWYRADIIIGSKRHPASKVAYPWQRRILSWGYQMGVRTLFGMNIRDTQVGMKFFKREVLEKVLPRVLVKKWAFDVELLAVSNYLGFNKIYEAPISLNLDFGGISIVTSKGFWKNIFYFVWDTSAVFYRLKIMHYYDTKNKKKWITPEYLMLKKK